MTSPTENTGPLRAEVVPFGKYKGQPVEKLFADHDYRDWLLAQPWFAEKFGNVYQTIINYGAEPQDTPEHNEMQVSFLNDARCLHLARKLYPTRTFAESEITYSASDKALHQRFRRHLEDDYEPARVVARKFEDHGWDVTYRINSASLALVITSLPLCTCGPCDHDETCDENSTCRNPTGDRSATYWCEHRHDRFMPTLKWFDAASPSDIQAALYKITRHHHAYDNCAWSDDEAAKWLLGDVENKRWYQRPDSGTIRVELKPDLGDDFPSVLRQVTRYDNDGHNDRRCVIVRRASFERVTWDQVTEIFRSSQIVLMLESDLTQLPEISP